MLASGALPMEAYAAMIGAAAQCPHHGRACNCPQACKRENKEEPAAHSEENVPACHRKPAAEKPKCVMNGCGGVEIPAFVVTGHDPYLGFALDAAFAADAWEKAFIEVLHVPPSKAYKPTPPPPRLLPMLIG